MLCTTVAQSVASYRPDMPGIDLYTRDLVIVHSKTLTGVHKIYYTCVGGSGHRLLYTSSVTACIHINFDIPQLIQLAVCVCVCVHLCVCVCVCLIFA